MIAEELKPSAQITVHPVREAATETSTVGSTYTNFKLDQYNAISSTPGYEGIVKVR